VKNNILILIAVGLLSLLASCAQMNPHPMDMTQAIQNAKTPTDHTALAKHYEDTAKEMQAKVDEHQKMLKQYQAESQYYGRQGLDMESMCQGLIRAYEQAAKANMDMADSHRKMTVEIK